MTFSEGLGLIGVWWALRIVVSAFEALWMNPHTERVCARIRGVDHELTTLRNMLERKLSELAPKTIPPLGPVKVLDDRNINAAASRMINLLGNLGAIKNYGSSERKPGLGDGYQLGPRNLNSECSGCFYGLGSKHPAHSCGPHPNPGAAAATEREAPAGADPAGEDWRLP